MIDPEHEDRKTWRNRILQSRRRYIYQRLLDLNPVRDIDFFQLLKWIKNDILHSSMLIRNVLRQLKANGLLIQHNYGVSKIRQFRRMMYLAFVVKVYPANFIKYRLFKQENWERVNDFAFAHTKSQRQFLEMICPQEAGLFLNKFKFFKFCKEHHIKTPNVLVLYENGRCTYSSCDKNNLPKENLFIKKRSGMMGKGAKKLSYRNGKYEDKEGIQYKKADVLDYLKTYSENHEAILLQNVLKNHSLWMNYTSGALATCRVVTCRSNISGDVKTLFASFRMPHGTGDTDNFSGGGLAASVNIENGILGKAVTAKPVNKKFEFSYHPDTNQQIVGTQLPKWKELLEFTANLHRHVRSVFVGWDVCLAEEGLCVMEGSLVWAADVIESTNNLPLYDTDYPLLYEKMMRKTSMKMNKEIVIWLLYYKQDFYLVCRFRMKDSPLWRTQTLVISNVIIGVFINTGENIFLRSSKN